KTPRNMSSLGYTVSWHGSPQTSTQGGVKILRLRQHAQSRQLISTCSTDIAWSSRRSNTAEVARQRSNARRYGKRAGCLRIARTTRTISTISRGRQPEGVSGNWTGQRILFLRCCGEARPALCTSQRCVVSRSEEHTSEL